MTSNLALNELFHILENTILALASVNLTFAASDC